MALDDSALLKDHAARPYHLTQIADIYVGETEDTIAGSDISADIEDAKLAVGEAIEAGNGDLQDTIDDYIASMTVSVNATTLSGSDKTALIATLASATTAIMYDTVTVKAATDAVLDAIPTTPVSLKSTLLNTINDELDAVILADTANFLHECIWCGGAGQYEKRKDAGEDPGDTTLTHCDPCDGFGRVKEQQEAIIVKPADVTYP